MNCPCQSGLKFEDCCGPLLQHAQCARDAEQLMRSRYSAFSLGNLEYLISSWHADYVPGNLQIDPALKWLNLEIIDFIHGEHDAVVEFEASFLTNGSVEALHERSRFVCQQGQWLYTDGDQLPASFKPWKPGRNEACPCGSGIKFKRCCARASNN